MRAEELAAQLEVSERTIYRDLDALSAAGVPIYAERGPGGGCTLPENYRTTLTGLNENEIHTLFMTGGSRPLADLGLGKALEDALLKLSAALPSTQRRSAELARERIYLDAASWFQPAETTPYLTMLQEAIWQEQRLCMVYRRSDGDSTEHLIEPYGLVAKASVWYLVAMVTIANSLEDSSEKAKMAKVEREPSVFRVARIQNISLTTQQFQRPANFKLPEFWRTSCTQFKSSFVRYKTVVRVAPSYVTTLAQILGESNASAFKEAGPADAQGWLTLHLAFERMENARSMLMGFGPNVEIIEPSELRQSIIELAVSITKFYSQK
jgi:predicted DNA-binding transcriptional regulator YafY